MKNQNIQRKKMWWYFTFSTGSGEDWEWAPKSKNSRKEVACPQDKELFKLQGSFPKNTRSQKPEFSQEGSFQYKTKIWKKPPFVLIVMSWWCSWSKISHLEINSLFFPGPRFIIWFRGFSYGKILYLGVGFEHKILAKTWGFSYGRNYALV